MNLIGSTVYRGSSLRVRIFVELTRMGYSCGCGVAALSDIVWGSSEVRDAVSNPDVTMWGDMRKEKEYLILVVLVV